MRYLSIGVAAVALAALAGVGNPQPSSTLAFHQLDIVYDGDKHHRSEWGVADLSFIGTSGDLYFNLVVNGRWVVQNMPVLSPEGPDVLHVTSFSFDLGVVEGTKVKSVAYAYELTLSPLAEPPQGATNARVGRAKQRLYTGYGDGPITFSAPSGPLQGAAGGAPSYTHKDFRNQQAGPDECVPAAVSSSLKWLNRKYNLGIPDASLSIDKMKTATDWDPKRLPRPGCDDNWPQVKARYLEANGIPVSTEQIGALEFHKVEDAMKKGCDVEIGIGSHTAAVTGIKKLAPGADAMDPDYSLVLTHDEDQKDPKGGEVDENVTYDDDFLRFHGPSWVENKPVGFIVVECPFTPTPTPTATPSGTPTHTRTPTPSPSEPTPTQTQTTTLTPATSPTP